MDVDEGAGSAATTPATPAATATTVPPVSVFATPIPPAAVKKVQTQAQNGKKHANKRIHSTLTISS
jgi:hypothetical protein